MRVYSLQLAAIALLALVSCRSKRPNREAQKVAEPAKVAVSGHSDRLTIAIDVEPLHLNPIDDCDEWCWRIAFGPIFEPIARLDGQGRLIPSGLTTFIEEDPDRRGYVFEIRPGAKWHDGSPVTSSDVAATFERILHPQGGLGALRRELRVLHMVERRDDRSGRIRLEEPNAFAPAILAEIPILPRAIVEWTGRGGAPRISRQAFSRKPVGSGPYRLNRWERGRRIVLERDPSYSGTPAHIKELHFVIERDGARALAMVRRGEIDLLPRVLPRHWPSEVQTPAVRALYREIRLRPNRYALLLPNLRRTPLNDSRVRQALGKLIDRAQMVKEARNGLGRVEFLSLKANELSPDATAAATLLDSADLRDTNGDGLREQRAGAPLKIDVMHVSPAPIVDEELKLLSSAWRTAGVELKSTPVSSAEFEARLTRGAFQVALVSWSTRRDPDPAPLVSSRGSNNLAGFSNAEIEDLLDRVRLESGDAREQARKDLVTRLKDQAPVIPLYAVEDVALVKKGLEGLTEGEEWFDLPSLRWKSGDAQ